MEMSIILKNFFHLKNIYDNFIYNISSVFNDSLINEEFNKLVEKIHNSKLNNSLRLKESYIQKPIYSTKNNIGKKMNGFSLIYIIIIFAFVKVKNAYFAISHKNVSIIFT